MNGTIAAATSPMRLMPPMITRPTSNESPTPKITAPSSPERLGKTSANCL